MLKKNIKTSDLYQTAYLLAAGNSALTDISWAGERAVFFLSADEDDLISWADGECNVCARKFMFKILFLKEKMFALKKGPVCTTGGTEGVKENG